MEALVNLPACNLVFVQEPDDNEDNEKTPDIVEFSDLEVGEFFMFLGNDTGERVFKAKADVPNPKIWVPFTHLVQALASSDENDITGKRLVLGNIPFSDIRRSVLRQAITVGIKNGTDSAICYVPKAISFHAQGVEEVIELYKQPDHDSGLTLDLKPRIREIDETSKVKLVMPTLRIGV
jgi:hypothetical protein